MRILWDFRLFSYGYADRGVGAYTRRCAEAVLREKVHGSIYVWADKKALPEEIQSWPVTWIPYMPGSWKQDLYRIPCLILRYNIDIFHYWICLGPIHSVGMGMVHPCRIIGTVYDLGVELWHDVPFAAAKRKTWYWKMQKFLIRHCTNVICISQATKRDLCTVLKKQRFHSEVVYVPQPLYQQEPSEKREPYFIALGGSPHKNLARTVAAFDTFREKYPLYELVILGDVDKKGELPDDLPPSVRFEDVTYYTFHRQHAAGLIFCSLHEGLGLPPLEAMAYGCPLLLSDIPSLREICDKYAYFVDPLKVEAITAGMEEIVGNQIQWVDKSQQGMMQYKKLCANAGKQVVKLYRT